MKLTKTDMFRNRLYNQLSGGERQRVILARAINQQPDIILLDEPTSALDLHHQIEVMELIRQLNEKEHITVLAVLHDINLASRFCSRIVILKDGKVKADGPHGKLSIAGKLFPFASWTRNRLRSLLGST